MDFDQLFPGRFIKSGEFEGRDVTLTISHVELEELEDDKGAKKMKGIISFRETKKKGVINKTNGLCLRAMWGRETDEWIGHRVTLFPEAYQGETAIRVKGSPELEEPLTVEIKMARKKPYKRTMLPTGKGKKPVVSAPADEPSDANEDVA